MVRIISNVALISVLFLAIFSSLISSDHPIGDSYLDAFVIVECPANDTISCRDSSDPSVTGMAMVSDGEMASFQDSIILDCPNRIIQRTWYASANGMRTDSCIQMITLEIDSVTNELDPIHQVTGFCSSDIDSIARALYPLNCNQSIVNLVTSFTNNSMCGSDEIFVTYNIMDECTGQVSAPTQIFQILDIPDLTISDIQIDSASGSNGTITYSIMQCQNADLSYSWVDSSGMEVSTDSTLMGAMSGDYDLIITSSLGCVDSFSFNIPQIGAIFINCPDDVTLGCNEDINDPMITGTATSSAGSLSFSDDTTQMCPVIIVERTYLLEDMMDDTRLDSCVQTITIQNNVDAMADTMRFSQMCVEPLSSFVSSIDLECSQTLESTMIDTIMDNCSSASYRVTYMINDMCADSMITRSQVLEFSDIPFVTISNTRELPDPGDSTGSISFDFMQCRSGDLTFAWSNGSTDTSLMNLSSGIYTLTVSGPSMCVDSFSFMVPVLSQDISCPPSDTISCDASIEPINIGFPMGGAMEDFSFSDSIIQECPMTIIDRTWTRNTMTASADRCIQRITLDPSGVRANFQDTVVVTGVCGADLEMFVDKDLPLSCGEFILEVTSVMDASSCDEVIFTTTWFGGDNCQGGTLFETQVTVFRDIAVANLSDIMITPDPDGMGGAISFDAMACKDDMLAYEWSTGSTDASIDSIDAGEYSVTVTNEMGCTQSFDFVVPIFLSLTCPDDITISCEIDADPSATGMPMVSGFDSIWYSDVITQDCPDRVIERSWFASISGGSLDTCVQMITQTDENLRANFMDTLVIQGQCSGMLDSLIAGTLPLGCNERIDFVATDPISSSCEREVFRTDWLLFDECTGMRTTLSQFTVFEQLQIIQTSNEVIEPAIGDSTGSISFDFASCKSDSVLFEWSNGSTATSISNLSSGTYTVTLTNTFGCEEIKSFDVPLSFALTCPDDIVISCSEMPDISVTGNATLQGFDTLTFVDSLVQTCPNTIIIRTFTGSSMNAESQSCSQLITLSNENVRADFQDTLVMSGVCVTDLSSLLPTAPPLRCGEMVRNMNMTSSGMMCGDQSFKIDWLVFDECANRTNIVSQTIVFEDIAVVSLENLDITADQEDNSGAISFDPMMCMGDTLTYEWSNGATSPTISGLAGDTYTLTVTNSIGCSDTFSFEVPFLFSFNCPSNISVSCETEDISPDLTGFPTFSGFENVTFEDNTTQMCPDRIITRTFAAITADSMMTDTCRQTITLRDNTPTIRDDFDNMSTLTGVCTDDVLNNPSLIIPLGCNENLDSSTVVVTNRGCERDVVNFTWHLTDMCRDTSYMVSQIVFFTDVPVITLDSIDIQGAQNGNDGSIIYSFDQCGDDSLSFVWNDLSTNPFLSNAGPGEYELRVTNEMGCRDTFNFIVPTDMSVVCPDDIEISCTQEPDTAVTGTPLVFGFDSFTFSDSLAQMCPNQVIERTFMAGAGTDASSCTQIITLLNDADIRSDFADTITVSGQCTNDLEELVLNTIPLDCNESVDSSSISVVNESCESAEAVALWFISDACSGGQLTVTQTILLDSVPFVTLSNTMLTRDDGMGTGGVDFDIDFCENNPLTFAWSDGSSNKSLIGVEGGLYTVTITNDVGCSEEFNFDIPAPLPFDSAKAFTISVVDRDDAPLENVSFRFLSSVGQEEIRSEQFTNENGEYTYVVEGELSEVGFICPSVDDAAIRLLSGLDIVRGQRLILGISESCPEDFIATDVNFSGGPTAADLVLIRRIILGLDQNFPSNESWRFVQNTDPLDLDNLQSQVAGCIPIQMQDISGQAIDLKGIKLGNLECAE